MTSAPTQVVVPPTRGATRRLAMTAYALALLVWSLTIGIPSDTLGVRFEETAELDLSELDLD